MKQIKIYAILLSTLLLGSCSDDHNSVLPPDENQPATLTLSLSVDATADKRDKTRATGDENALDGEARIRTICMAVFKEDKSLLSASFVDQGHTTATTPDTIRLDVKSGKHTLVVLVNMGNPAFTTLDELKAITLDLDEQTTGNLAMSSAFIPVDIQPGMNYIGPISSFSGYTNDAHFLPNAAAQTYQPVEVTRLAGRIDFLSLDVDWSDADAAELAKEEATFRLKRVYMLNVKKKSYVVNHPTDTYVSCVEVPGADLCNGRNDESTGYQSFLDLKSDAAYPILVDGKQPVTFGSTDAPSYSCYVYEHTEAPAYTSLVLVGDITDRNGQVIMSDRYYTVKINQQGAGVVGDPGFEYIRRNYIYRLHATITGKGSESENQFANAYVTAQIEVAPWEIRTQKENDVN